MSRHGSGKRRRTSPDPNDTGAAHPDASPNPESGHVDDSFDAGSYGSGEYATYGSEPYDPAAYDPATYDPTAYDPNAYGTESPEPQPSHPGAYRPESYEPESYEPESYPPPATYEPEPFAAEPYRPESYEAAAYGASAYDPSTDPALGGHTAEFAAVADEPDDPDEPADRPAAAATADPGTGMRPAPPPLEGDIIKLVSAGSLIWFTLFVVAWFQRDTLEQDGHGWWPWCALAGAGLGLFGLWYCRRLQNARED